MSTGQSCNIAEVVREYVDDKLCKRALQTIILLHLLKAEVFTPMMLRYWICRTCYRQMYM